MNEPVTRSEPVMTTITRPMGKIMAPNILIRPGAFSWYQGELLTTRQTAAAKASKAPAMKLLMKILSILILAL